MHPKSSTHPVWACPPGAPGGSGRTAHPLSNERTCAPVCQDQNLIAISSLPDASRVPHGLHSTVLTQPVGHAGHVCWRLLGTDRARDRLRKLSRSHLHDPPAVAGALCAAERRGCCSLPLPVLGGRHRPAASSVAQLLCASRLMENDTASPAGEASLLSAFSADLALLPLAAAAAA